MCIHFMMYFLSLDLRICLIVRECVYTNFLDSSSKRGGLLGVKPLISWKASLDYKQGIVMTIHHRYAVLLWVKIAWILIPPWLSQTQVQQFAFFFCIYHFLLYFLTSDSSAGHCCTLGYSILFFQVSFQKAVVLFPCDSYYRLNALLLNFQYIVFAEITGICCCRFYHTQLGGNWSYYRNKFLFIISMSIILFLLPVALQDASCNHSSSLYARRHSPVSWSRQCRCSPFWLNSIPYLSAIFL